MWIILVNRNITDQRNSRIDSILGDNIKEEYLSKINNSKYSHTSYINYALTFKTASGANRVVKKFNSLDKIQRSNYKSRFSWVSEFNLTIRRLSKQEWDGIVDHKINLLDNKYKRQRAKLENMKR